jgi:SOS response regulatory protein OraA/RecX
MPEAEAKPVPVIPIVAAGTLIIIGLLAMMVLTMRQTGLSAAQEYALNAMSAGMRPERITQALVTQGWKATTVERAVHNAYMEIAAKSIKERLEAGISERELRTTLSSNGWTAQDISQAIKQAHRMK